LPATLPTSPAPSPCKSKPLESPQHKARHFRHIDLDPSRTFLWKETTAEAAVPNQLLKLSIT
jgi:hypothetical protein